MFMICIVSLVSLNFFMMFLFLFIFFVSFLAFYWTHQWILSTFWSGVGSTIGAGVYILVGTVAREHTGPALTISVLIAGIAAALSAFCYYFCSKRKDKGRWCWPSYKSGEFASFCERSLFALFFHFLDILVKFCCCCCCWVFLPCFWLFLAGF